VNEQLGPELSATARQLIADARGADEPSAEDEARVKARWLAGIAAGAGVSSLSEAVRAAASTGWGLKAGALVAALAAATAGVILGWPQTSGHPSSQEVSTVPAARTGREPAAAVQTVPAQPVVAAPVAQQPVAQQPVAQQPVAQQPVTQQPVAPQPVTEQPAAVPPSAPEVVKPAVEAAAPTEAAVQQPQPAAAPPRAGEVKEVRATAPRAAASARRAEKLPEKPVAAATEEPAAVAPLSGQLGEEIAALSEIRSNLQTGAASLALEQLSEYRRRFGQPSLAMEADALRVDALCRAGQREAARTAATAFASNWPNSPLQQRVSAACP